MKKVLLSEVQLEQIMMDGSMIASRAFADHFKHGFDTELLLVAYSAWLSGVICDRLFKEVSCK